MNPPPPPLPQEPPNHGRTKASGLRFLIWMTPSMMIPMIFGACIYFARITGSLTSLLAMVGAIAGTIGLGLYDAKLKRQQKRLTKEQTGGDGAHATVFFVLQLLIVPAVLGGVAFAFCAMNSYHL